MTARPGRWHRNIVRSATLGWLCCAQHIHPSGTACPSAKDLDLTGRVKDLLDEIDVRLLDHIVVSRTETVSMAARGLI